MSDTQQAGGASGSKVIPSEYLVPFLIVTPIFALWGFANDITNPMVKAFKNILLLSNFESSLVQAAFYGGYCVMAIPAALYIRRSSYKAGLLMGLALYTVGCLLFAPAGWSMQFWAFLTAYFVMTSGLAFLETSANPYILAMGPSDTAPRRLNFAQAFNPLGSFTGMMVARTFILARLDETTEEERRVLVDSDPDALAAIQQADLSVIVGPYLMLGGVVAAVLVFFLFARLPAGESHDVGDPRLLATLSRLMSNGRYVGGVIAQAFYVGVQIMCWTFIIQYAVNELGISAADAQGYNMIAMLIFISSRFVCTYLLKYINPGMFLGFMSVLGASLICVTIFVGGYAGLYSLIAVSACMSLMFPTIYGIALEGLGDDAKLASAGLIAAIGGGCFMPPLQGLIMDGEGWELGFASLTATRASFSLSVLCFAVVGAYGFMCRGRKRTD